MKMKKISKLSLLRKNKNKKNLNFTNPQPLYLAFQPLELAQVDCIIMQSTGIHKENTSAYFLILFFCMRATKEFNRPSYKPFLR